MAARDAFERLLAVADTMIAGLDRAGADAVLGDVRTVVGFVEAVRLRVVARIDEIADTTGNADPAVSASAAARTSRRDGERTRRRAHAASAAPPLADALAAGAISPDHLDALATTLTRLEPDDRVLLLDDPAGLATLARSLPADDFARALTRRVDALGDDRRQRRYERQRHDTALRWWTDPITGMIRLTGEFDPATGLALTQRIARTADTLFHDHTPDTAPTDPLRRQHHLRALALLHAVLATPLGGADSGAPTTEPSAGTTSSSGATPPLARGTVDMVVVIDFDTLLGQLRADSRVELPLDAELPVATLRRIACTAGIIPAVLDSHGVVVDLGRRQRLATTDQRRALRAMYRTCAIDPACQVPYEHCEPHHINWWTRDHGTTDLDNLVPTCSTHHHRIHEGGWRLTLRRADRQLTITQPDGTTWSTLPDSAPAREDDAA